MISEISQKQRPSPKLLPKSTLQILIWNGNCKYRFLNAEFHFGGYLIEMQLLIELLGIRDHDSQSIFMHWNESFNVMQTSSGNLPLSLPFSQFVILYFGDWLVLCCVIRWASHEKFEERFCLEDAFALSILRKFAPTSIGNLIHGNNKTKISMGC